MKQVLQVNGFTRTASTYTYTAVKLAFPEYEVTHTHDYLDLGYRALTNQPVIATIRNPLDTIASTLVQINKEQSINTAKQIIENYIKHLHLINIHKDKIIVSTFEQVTNDFNIVLNNISEFYNINHLPISLDDIKNNLPEYKDPQEDLRFGRFPRNNNYLKGVALETLKNNVLSGLLNKANNIYGDINDYTNNRIAR